MLLSTINPEAAAAIGQIKKVGVGNVVVYHARAGYMRDRRSDFPGLVLRQHADDGSLDLFVIMEREDFAVEERVAFQSHNQPHHCWSVVTDTPVDAQAEVNKFASGMIGEPEGERDDAAAGDLAGRLDALPKRVTLLEMKGPPNRFKPKQPPERDTSAEVE